MSDSDCVDHPSSVQLLPANRCPRWPHAREQTPPKHPTGPKQITLLPIPCESTTHIQQPTSVFATSISVWPLSKFEHVSLAPSEWSWVSDIFGILICTNEYSCSLSQLHRGYKYLASKTLNFFHIVLTWKQPFFENLCSQSSWFATNWTNTKAGNQNPPAQVVLVNTYDT